MLSVYLADLNELIGKWIQLPMSRESLEKEVKEIIGNNEGYFITEYSTEYEMTIHSFMDIYELNELIIELQEIVQRHDATVVKAAFRYFSELEDVVKCMKNSNYSMLDDVESTHDLGYAIVKQGLFDIKIPKELMGYIDYEIIGEEFESSGYTIYMDLKVAIHFY